MEIATQSDFPGIRKVWRLRVTQRRVDANRRNAAHSTGPRTPQGKARVRLNAIRHGFRARDETCLAAAGDNAARLIATNIEGLAEYFHPGTAEEKAIVADIALNMWKADRASVLEMQSRWWEKSSSDPDWPRTQSWLNALMRYDNRAHRVIYRGYDALLKARRIRDKIAKNARTNPLAPGRDPLSSPECLAGEAAAARERSDGDGSGVRFSHDVAAPLRENARTNPLAGEYRGLHPHPSVTVHAKQARTAPATLSHDSMGEDS